MPMIAIALRAYVQDPLEFVHQADSYFDLWALFNMGHYVADPNGFGFHQDAFGVLNPLHYVDFAFWELFGSSAPTTLTCQMNVGCQ
jgi:hypothetical protein